MYNLNYLKRLIREFKNKQNLLKTTDIAPNPTKW